MKRYVTDTHALVWHLQSSPKLSATARTIFHETDAGQCQIVVPTIVLVELVFMAERKRIAPEMVARAFGALTPDSANYRIAPLDVATVRTLQTIDRTDIPEMPDRIIAATAKRLHVPLITYDKMILMSNAVSVIW